MRFLAGLTRRENAFLDQPREELDAERIVDAKQRDGHAANRRAADQGGPIPAEMRRPLVAAGIEKRRQLPGLSVAAANIRKFFEISI